MIDSLNCVLDLLQDQAIPACVVGVLALNYYNVPRVVHVSALLPLCTLSPKIG